jgi:predicted MFS family arabinose efflux permease
MLTVLFLVRLAMGYQFQSVASVSSHLVDEFGFSYTQVGALIGFFLLPGIVIAVPSGLMTRAVADKNLLMIGAITMILGAMLMGSASDPQSLYLGRLATGVGGTIFNVILTKMVSDWFEGHEIVTALAVMLTAWPIGIALGLLTQGSVADSFGWPWVMYATGAVALVALLLTATLYRDVPVARLDKSQPLRLGLPLRQFIHMSVVGAAWTLYNATIIITVSFSPDLLIERGYEPPEARAATSLLMWVTLISIPIGGRLLEQFASTTRSMVVTLLIGAGAILMVSRGAMPEASLIAFGLFGGIPAGALMALSAQAITPDNRGPGLGIFYTWYYVGMTIAPAVAGWTRDGSQNTAAPVVLAAAMLAAVVLLVGLFRVLQAVWSIEPRAANAPGTK